MLGPRGVTRARQLRPLRLWPRRPWRDGSIMASMQKRLQKELLALQNDPPPGMTLNEKSVQNSITQWIVDMEGAPGTLYEGEKFQLLFKFSSRYPFDSPQMLIEKGIEVGGCSELWSCHCTPTELDPDSTKRKKKRKGDRNLTRPPGCERS
nr:ubiquitin-conjugating enzyme E2 W isoform X2 [Microcebus murinus]